MSFIFFFFRQDNACVCRLSFAFTVITAFLFPFNDKQKTDNNNNTKWVEAQVNNPPGTNSLWNRMNFSNRNHEKKSHQSVSRLAGSLGSSTRSDTEVTNDEKNNSNNETKNIRTRDEICDFPVVGKFKHVQSNWCVSSSWMFRTKRSWSSLLYMPHEIGQLNTLERKIGTWKKEARAAIQLANKVRRNNGSMSSRNVSCACVLLSYSPPRQLGEVNFSFSLSSSVNVDFFFYSGYYR